MRQCDAPFHSRALHAGKRPFTPTFPLPWSSDESHTMNAANKKIGGRSTIEKSGKKRTTRSCVAGMGMHEGQAERCPVPIHSQILPRLCLALPIPIPSPSAMALNTPTIDKHTLYMQIYRTSAYISTLILHFSMYLYLICTSLFMLAP